MFKETHEKDIESFLPIFKKLTQKMTDLNQSKFSKDEQ